MRVIRERDDPAFFRFITDGNLLRQYDFLRASVDVALKATDYVIDHNIVRQLNNHAVAFLCDTPGQYRQKPIYINNSAHKPPPHEEVHGHVEAALQYVAANWEDKSAVHLAAYLLWRLNWIHPFVEGNGRTARATCYLALCVKHRLWLPGKKTVMKQIRDDRQPYYAALREADDHFKVSGNVIVTALEAYLNGLLTIQLSS